MPAKALISEPQWDVIIKNMRDHPHMARGSVPDGGPIVKRKLMEQWNELASRLNSVGIGAKKSPSKWRDYWHHAKYSAKKKASAQKERLQQLQASQIEFGLPKRLIVLTEREQLILRSIGKAADQAEVNDQSQNIIPASLQNGSVSPKSLPRPVKRTKPTKEDDTNKRLLDVEDQTPSTIPVPASPQTPSEISESSHSHVFNQISESGDYILDVHDDVYDDTQTSIPASLQTSPVSSVSLPADETRITTPVSLPKPKPPELSPPLTLPNPPSSSSIGSPPPIANIDISKRVAVVDSNMSRISQGDLNLIKNQLQQKLWDHMIDTSTASQPVFEYCTVLEPFALIFKCCNPDAVDWLTNTVEDTLFVGHNLAVILDDLENKLPKTVDLFVNINSDFGLNDIESVFNVLVRTNQSWLNAPQWKLLHGKCVSVSTFDPSDGMSFCVVFSVLLNDIRRLREGGFKLHFLFGVIPVGYYEETKIEVCN